MDSQTIDQTASETQLHRVLWLIKFLRAMVLHMLLALIAALAFFLAVIDGIYPLATDMIHAIRVQAIEDHLQGKPIGLSGYAIVATVVFGAMLALLVWIYRSITNVRRYALRFQAVVILIACLLAIGPKWQQVKFAFENLNLLFAVLAALGAGMVLLVVPLSVAFALWGVARASERSSFVATLDPRLAPGFWTYFNKLLDLESARPSIPTGVPYAPSGRPPIGRGSNSEKAETKMDADADVPEWTPFGDIVILPHWHD